MIRIFIEPTDVLIFRSGLPFDAGSDSYAPGLFPPSPEPLQGALRECLARAIAGDRTLEQTFTQEMALLGDREQPGRFRMRGPFLAHRKLDQLDVIERLYPPPADLIVGREGTAELLMPTADETDDLLTNWPQDAPLHWLRRRSRSDGKEQVFRNWLTDADLAVWQSGDSPQIAEIRGVPSDKLWQIEPRFGIKVGMNSRTVEDGFLYRLEFVRLLPGVGLDVDVWLEGTASPTTDELSTLLASSWGRLGGEGRTARYSVVAAAPVHPPPAGYRSTKLYLATPALFGGGWQPTGGDWADLLGSATFVTAAVPRFIAIGGWSMRFADQGGNHKLMRRHVPAGSIYYFADNVLWADTVRLTDEPTKAQIGYGVCYAGAW